MDLSSNQLSQDQFFAATSPENGECSTTRSELDIFLNIHAISFIIVTSRDVVTLMMGLDLSSTTVEEEKAPTSKSRNGGKCKNLVQIMMTENNVVTPWKMCKR